MFLNNSKIAGGLSLVGSVQFLLAIIVAEAIYPGYSISANYISDLGVWGQRSANIFNPSTVLFGALVVTSSYYIQKRFKIRSISILFAVAGAGSMGVGIFPENTFIINGVPIFHAIAAGLSFIIGGISAIASYKITKAPFRYFSVIMGTTTLVAAILAFSTMNLNYLGLGVGGIERMIAYPTLFWIISFGGYLLADQN